MALHQFTVDRLRLASLARKRVAIIARDRARVEVSASTRPRLRLESYVLEATRA